MKEMEIIIKELDISSTDIKKSNDIQYLKNIKIELDLLLTRLKDNLESYKIDFKEKGISGDYDWFKRTQTKKRLYGIVSQIIQTKIGELNKENRLLREKEFDKVLIRNLKEIITSELFEKALEKTRVEFD